MPFRSRDPILHVEPASLTSVDTNNVMNLHGLWSVFSKCAETMEEGKRLENLSWRVFSRETFVCRNTPVEQRASLPPRLGRHRFQSSESVPDLSSSLESDASSTAGRHMELATRSCPTSARPELRRTASTESRTGRKEKHISPLDLEKIVISIKEKTALEPLSPLPPSLSIPKEEPAPLPSASSARKSPQITPTPSTPPAEMSSSTHLVPDSSSSTVATAATTVSDLSEIGTALATSESTSTEMSATSIVRGFSKDHISSCYRSHTQLAPTPTQSILKSSPAPRSDFPLRRKAAPKFIVGGSSGEDGDSLENRYLAKRSSLSEGLRRSNNKKTTSFKDEVSTRMIQDKTYESEEVFEESDEEEDQSESAIEDDEDVEEEWEDEEEETSGSPKTEDKDMFQRVDSRPNLTSRRSLLTTQLHEKDRAIALQNAASKSTSAIRRSRAASPIGESALPPQNMTSALRLQPTAARPIVMTTPNTHPPALSPRTTRRNMLQTELTESLRKHLIWERQVRGSTTNAVLKRRHTSNDIKNLKEYPGTNANPGPVAYLDYTNDKLAANASSWNNYFDTGLQEYHQKGW